MQSVTILFQVHIKSDVNRTWIALTQEVHEWWLKDFHTSPKVKRVVIEPWLGGKMYEDFGDGEGLVWAVVIGVDSPNSIQFRGNLTPEFGGSAITFKKLSLHAEGGTAVLTVSDTLLGDEDENSRNQIEEGWRMIYAHAFKNHVETKFDVQ